MAKTGRSRTAKIILIELYFPNRQRQLIPLKKSSFIVGHFGALVLVNPYGPDLALLGVEIAPRGYVVAAGAAAAGHALARGARSTTLIEWGLPSLSVTSERPRTATSSRLLTSACTQGPTGM